MTDSYEEVTAAFADLTDRVFEYAGVWRDAIARNAAGTYRADDFLVDAQTLCGMGVRDMVRAVSAVLAVSAPRESEKGPGAPPGRAPAG